MRFRLLGPTEVLIDGAAVPLPGTRQRALLTALLLSANRPVTVDHLVDAVWGEEPPASAGPNLRQHLTALRRRLGTEASRIVGRSGRGYLIEVRPGELDLDVFTGLVRQARERTDPEEIVGLLGQALALWRGEPLQDVPPYPIFTAAATRFREHRIAALEEWFDARLGLGHHEDVLPELRAQVVEHPLRERLWALLMRGLCQAGRQGDALEAFLQARGTLAEELGIAPGAELQELHRSILAAESESPGPRPVPRRQGNAAAPWHLPRAVSHFTGRADQLAELERLTDVTERIDASAVVISAIAGGGGVGKTALAVHFGHHAAGRFPHGQLFVDLRGFDPSRPPMSSGDALEYLLQALGVDPGEVPEQEDRRAALYRGLLSGKRMLVVLDNAVDAEQVRPLLPGEPGCLAVVTSRNRLAGLVARDGAHRLTLGALSPAEAVELLGRIIGADRLDAEPAAAHRLARLCGCLPLALRIAAERAMIAPGPSLTALADDLADERSRLDVLEVDDDGATSIRAVLSWSYRALPAEAARMFRLLSLHPGPEFGPEAAAALCDLTPDEAGPLVDALADCHLLEVTGDGRYRFHDLVRVYAAHSMAEEEPGERATATHRLLDWYLRTAAAGRSMLTPDAQPHLPDGEPGRCPALVFVTREEALAWYELERVNLVASVRTGVEAGHLTLVSLLSRNLLDYLYIRSRWAEQMEVHRNGIDAAHRSGRASDEAAILIAMGSALRERRRYDEAIDAIRRAIDLQRSAGEGEISGRAIIGLAITYTQIHRYDEARECLHESLAQVRADEDRYGEASALINLGYVCLHQNEFEEAIRWSRESLGIWRAIEDPRGEGYGLDCMAQAYEGLRRPGDALRHFEQAVAVLRRSGDLKGEASTLRSVARLLRETGRTEAALDRLHRALAVLEELDDPEADEVRALIAAV
ncbi:AfsR/SARP family transcriptional regulator [Streptosporangium pseudovulgare]|uniref:SARP family transcriptional regulator n=1 Tax=Streptosporangium pseudovulgare TaxID=35765 RepID=A0ABQ2QT66_9ACTN|nr:BTAD domain-containing putative transcriptional regulator [Streptosporangium pseudovulgare]GGP92330.1 SARP family transcriptional regulator [Streptosporangium pseudovulgare]